MRSGGPWGGASAFRERVDGPSFMGVGGVTYRLLLALLAALFLLPGLARAEGERAAGVLVGLAVKPGNDLRTLWLFPRAEGFAALELTPLVVPRRDGFWRLGIQRRCAQSSELDARTAARAAGPRRRRSASGRCPVNGRGTPPASSSCKRRKIDCRTDRSIDLHFVWPDHVSLGESSSHDCGAHPDGELSTSVLGLTSLNRVTIGAALGPAGSEAFRRALEVGEQEAGRRMGVARWPTSRRRAGRSGAKRGAGSWWAGPTPTGSAGTASTSPSTPRPPPGSWASAPRWIWRRSKQSVRGATDAFAAPDGQTILAVLPDALALLAGGAPAPRAPVLRVPLREHEEVVMAEWATGGQRGPLDRRAGEDPPAARGWLPSPGAQTRGEVKRRDRANHVPRLGLTAPCSPSPVCGRGWG